MRYCLFNCERELNTGTHLSVHTSRICVTQTMGTEWELGLGQLNRECYSTNRNHHKRNTIIHSVISCACMLATSIKHDFEIINNLKLTITIRALLSHQ